MHGWVGPRTGLDAVEKSKYLSLPGLDSVPSVIQPVASRYTNRAIIAHRTKINCVLRYTIHDFFQIFQNKLPWPESASELHRPSDRRLSAKLVLTFADRGFHVVKVTDLYGRILGFLDLSRYFFFQVAPQLYSRGWVDPVPDPLLLRKPGSAGNWTLASGSVARNSDH
jgi:hypothetical protein